MKKKTKKKEQEETPKRAYNSYPWDKWFANDGPVVIERGKDYICETHIMTQQIRTHVYRHLRRSVSIKTGRDKTTLTVTLGRRLSAKKKR